MAARCARAAVDDAGDRFLERRHGQRCQEPSAAFRQGVSETGYIEGQSVMIEYHWAEGHHDRLPGLTADLVRRQVSVIAATGTPAALAAKRCDHDHSDRLRDGRRPDQAGPGGQPEPAGWQHHRRDPVEFRIGVETTGAAARFDTHSHDYRFSCEPDRSENRDPHDRDSWRRHARLGCKSTS